MKSWWDNLSARERTLISVAVILATVLAISLGVIRPLNSWKQSAEADLERARASLDLVTQAAATGGGQTTAAPNGSIPLRQAITTTAAALQIELVRIGADVDGQAEVQPGRINGDILFEWFNTLAADYGVEVAFADISRADDGSIESQLIVFSRGRE